MVMRARAYSYVISAISAAAGKEDALLPWLAPWDIQKPTDRRIRARNGSAGAQGGRALISQFWRFGQPG